MVPHLSFITSMVLSVLCVTVFPSILKFWSIIPIKRTSGKYLTAHQPDSVLKKMYSFSTNFDIGMLNANIFPIKNAFL